MLMTILMLAAAASPTGAKTMAHDSWHALSIVGVAASEGAGSPLYLRVRAGDLDGDGLDDEAALKLNCSGGAIGDASYRVISPRDPASGQASGKRQHKPVTFIKEWGAASPQLSAIAPTYDVKMLKGARVAAGAAGWTALSLGSSDGLCAAASEAAAKVVTKTSSNIQNN